MSQDLERAVDVALKVAEDAGATGAEAYGQEGVETTIRVFQGSVDTVNVSHTRGIGVRVYVGNRHAFVAAGDLAHLGPTVREAVALAAEMDPDDCDGMPAAPENQYPEVVTYLEEIEDTTPRDKADRLLRIEEDVRSRDERVHTENFTYRDRVTTVHIESTAGVDALARHSGYYIFGVASMREADRGGRGHFVRSGLGPGGLDEKSAADELWEILETSLEGESFPPAAMNVVLSPECAGSLARSLSMAFLGNLAAKGQSFLSGSRDQKVASDLLTLVDDQTLDGRDGSAPFDGEGVPAQRTVLMEEGTVRDFLTDTYWGRRVGFGSTANASRGGYGNLPGVSPSNFFVAPGEASPEAVIERAESGVYVLDMLSVGGINPITGDFSVAACGRRIENGRLGAPVAGVTVAGKIPEMLNNVLAVGSDLTWRGSCGAPTMAFSGLTVGGQ